MHKRDKTIKQFKKLKEELKEEVRYKFMKIKEMVEEVEERCVDRVDR